MIVMNVGKDQTHQGADCREGGAIGTRGMIDHCVFPLLHLTSL